MIEDVTLAIGGGSVLLKRRDARPLLREWREDEARKMFVDSAASPDLTIEVSWEAKGPVETVPDRWEMQFDTNASWRMWRERGTGATACQVLEVMNPLYDSVRPYVSLLIDWKASHADLILPKALTVGLGEVALPLLYPLDEVLWIHLLAERQNGAFILHAFGCVWQGKVYAFTGVSGAGKTTLSRALRAQMPGAVILSDDRLILRRGPRGEILCAGTPWHGEAREASTDCLPLAGILFLQQDAVDRWQPLPTTGSHYANLVARILRLSFPALYDAERMERTLGCMEDVVRQVPCFQLHFTKSLDLPGLLQDLAKQERQEIAA